MIKKRSKADIIRKQQHAATVKVAREWFMQMIEEVRRSKCIFPDTALGKLETRVREWRP